MWFTSDDPNVGIYCLDPSSNTWTLLNQATFFAASGGSFPGGQFTLHVGSNAADATVTLHFRSVDTVNPGADGDTLDILNGIVDCCQKAR